MHLFPHTLAHRTAVPFSAAQWARKALRRDCEAAITEVRCLAATRQGVDTVTTEHAFRLEPTPAAVATGTPLCRGVSEQGGHTVGVQNCHFRFECFHTPFYATQIAALVARDLRRRFGTCTFEGLLVLAVCRGLHNASHCFSQFLFRSLYSFTSDTSARQTKKMRKKLKKEEAC